MKKLLTAGMMIILILALALPAGAAAEITVFIDGEQVIFDVPPIIIEGRTLVPLRAIFEGLGMTVNYEGNTKTITGISPTKRIVLRVNSTAASITDLTTGITTAATLDVPAMIIEGRTLVPLRFVGEATGADVQWIGSTRTILITTGTGPEPDPDNLPPTALADPVEFDVIEQTALVMDVSQLAEDNDMLTDDELVITGYHFNGPVIGWGGFTVAPDGQTISFTSIDISSPATQYVVIDVTDGTHAIDVNVEIDISVAVVMPPNLPPVAAGDPVEFGLYEHQSLAVPVGQLAEDLDMWTSDVLHITGLVSPSAGMSFGTATVTPDGLAFSFFPDDVSKPAVHYLVAQVSDGTHTIDVNVEITVMPLIIVNTPPYPVADPVEMTVFEQTDLEIGVYDLAWDIDRDNLTIVSYRSGLGIFGKMVISPDGSQITFRSFDISKTSVHSCTVTVSDGTSTTDVNLRITITPTKTSPLNVAPTPKGNPVEFEVLEIMSIEIDVYDLATDINRDKLTIEGITLLRFRPDYGTWTIAPDGGSFLFDPDPVSEDVTQELVVTVSDGSLTTTVNVEIHINNFELIPIPY